MNDLVVQGIVAAVVAGVLDGFRRSQHAKESAASAAEAETRTRQLGGNLGPRVEDIDRRLARVEGKLGVAPPGPDVPKG